MASDRRPASSRSVRAALGSPMPQREPAARRQRLADAQRQRQLAGRPGVAQQRDGALERAALDVDVGERREHGRQDDRVVGGEQRQGGDGVGLGAAEIATPVPARTRAGRASWSTGASSFGPGPPRRRRSTSRSPWSACPRTRWRSWRRSARSLVAGAARAGCSERTSTSSCPSPHAASASAATSTARCGPWWQRTRPRSWRAGCAPPPSRPRLTSVLERQQPLERLGTWKPADQAGRGGLELEPEEQLPIEVVGRRRATSSQAAIACGSSAARKRTMERPSAACARSAGLLDRRCACSMRPAASGMRAADSAAPRSSRSRPPQRGRRVLLERPAQESHRLLRRAAVAGPSRRGRQRIERPSLADGAGGAGGQQVGGHALAPSRVARELTGGGQMELHPLGRRRSSPGAPAGRSGGRTSAAGPDAGARPRSTRPPRRPPRSRSTPATSAVSASEASSPRIASARATAATVGERRCSRAATNRATDGGPMAAIAPASRLARSAPRSSSAAMS